MARRQGMWLQLTPIHIHIQVKKAVTVRRTLKIVWAKSARGVWGLANVFANGKLYFTCDVPETNCLPQGLEPNLLPSLPPKLPNLVPNPTSALPNLLPRWQPSLQPNLQLESPFLWPLLSMCSSSRSNICVRKSGTQSLFLSGPEHASLRAVSWSFRGSHALVFASLVLRCASFP